MPMTPLASDAQHRVGNRNFGMYVCKGLLELALLRAPPGDDTLGTSHSFSTSVVRKKNNLA